MENQIYKTMDPKNPNIIIFTDEYGNYAKVDELPYLSTMMIEFRHCHPDIPVAEILDIYVHPQYRKQRFGSALIQAIVSRYKSRAILTLVGAHEREYPELDEENIPEIISKLIPFYEKNGFISVNNIFGTYNNFEPMLYNNNWYGLLVSNEL